MNKSISILTVGIGGYGMFYIDALLNNANADCSVAGVVDPKPENSGLYDLIIERKIPIYSSIEEFFEVQTADLTIISSPIQFHCHQVCLALKNGSNVLCEKPLSATVEDALRMIKAKEATGKFLAIGYQWSFAKSIQGLKNDIMKGVFGRPKRLKALVLWPRDDMYYERGWAGKKKDALGNWVLDSVANNAAAHYLHNMFYVLGEKTDSSIRPEYVTAELYRANNIENFDTTAVRILAKDGIEMMFFASHAVDELLDPTFIYEFENAVVSYDINAVSEVPVITAVFKDGTVKSYGDPASEGISGKLQASISAVRDGAGIVCGAGAALSHTLCINAMQESTPEINVFPEDIVKTSVNASENTRTTYVEGLAGVLKDCYDKWLLPSERGAYWAKAGKTIKIDEIGGL